MSTPASASRRFTPALTVALGLVIGGCGSSDHNITLHPLAGVVTLAGEPVSRAALSFHPVDRAGWPRGVPFPRAFADERGEFSVRTFAPGDGAPAGAYRVTVSQPIEFETPDGLVEQRDQLKGKYDNQAVPVAEVRVPAEDELVIQLATQ